MTKIEQWQEWAKQHYDLQEKLADTKLDLYFNSSDTENFGYIKYEPDGNRIIIHVKGQDEVYISVHAGKELLSVLKQL